MTAEAPTARATAALLGRPLRRPATDGNPPAGLTLVRAGRFSAVGALGIVVQLVVLWLLVGRFGLHYLAATLAATEAAVLHNFVWHVRWTWRDRPASTNREVLWRLWRFHVSNGGISIAGNLVLMALLTGIAGMHYFAANLVAIGVCAVANLVVSDLWVFRRAAAAIACVVMTGTGGAGARSVSADAAPVELKEATREAFQQYVRQAETRIDRRLAGRDAFLWTDESPARVAGVRRGEVVTGPSADRAVTEVPDGLVFDLTGAVFVAGATLDAVLGVMQDYPNHKVYYAPEVLDSATRSRDGDDFVVYLRLRKKKVLTVVLDTEHQARYVRLDDRRVHSRSVSTRIVEVENDGQRDERTLPAGAGHGFLWALNSYWRLHEREGGVLVECQAISLSRDIPWGLGWLIEPIVNDLPVESLERTLAATRAAVAALRPR